MLAPSHTADHLLGRKLDSIPFSGYHILIIVVLALVGFIEGYDLVITGSLLVLAKVPLHLTESDIRWLAVGPTFMLCLGGFAASAVSDHWSRKTVMLIGVVATTFCTLLIPLVQSAEQLIALRLVTGIGAGGAVSAAFPIAAELMPAQRSGDGIFRDPREPALASGSWPSSGGGRHRQRDHQAVRRHFAAIDHR